MFALSVVLFLTGLIGLICLLVIGGPMARAAERQFGLAANRDAIKALRAERGGMNAQSAVLEERTRELTATHQAMRGELKELDEKIGRMPKQTHELTFELGEPDSSMLPFDFVLSRQAGFLDAAKAAGPEQQLWKQPRMLRVWSRNQTNAATAAEKRYGTKNGFVIRAAMRVESVSGRPAANG
jgi:hypothetical protein